MIVSIVNQKGGTGKTTTAVNLGAVLARKKKKVLLIDLDPQGSLSYSLGISEFENSMADVLLGEVSINDTLQSAENMSVAPSDTGLADSELTIFQIENRESILKEAMGGVDKFDFVLIDCPPSLSLLTINALNASDRVIIPMQMEVLSLQGLDLIVNTISRIKDAYNPDLDILGILPVMVDRRRKLSMEVYDHIAENYQFKIFDSQIRTNVRATEAPSFGTSVIEYDPACNSAKDYMALGKEFLKLTN